jgi:hypothetical protein
VSGIKVWVIPLQVVKDRRDNDKSYEDENDKDERMKVEVLIALQ